MAKFVSTVHNPDSTRQFFRDIEPKIGIENAFTVVSNYKTLNAGDAVTAQSWTVQNDKYCVVLDNGVPLPISKLEKPLHSNKGLKFETTIANKARAAGILSGEPAGCSESVDCSLLTFNGEEVKMEIKDSARVVGGQTVLHFDNGHWIIPEKTREKYPTFAACVESATCEGTPLLQVVNERVKPFPKGERPEGVSINSDDMDLTPSVLFLQSKGVDLLHIQGRGTYRISDLFPSLPVPTGYCRIRVRRKHRGTITAQVDFKHIEPSPVHFDFFSEDGMKNIKESYLGYPKKPTDPPRLDESTEGTAVPGGNLECSGDRED